MPDETLLHQVHATAVARDGRGILLRGSSGSGKSDLALRLLDRGWMLVADDRVELIRAAGTVTMRPPQRIRGLLEVRGIGILRMTEVAEARLDLLVDLVARAEVERLPETRTETVCGVAVPYLRLYAFDVSTPLKLEYALDHPGMGTEGMWEAFR